MEKHVLSASGERAVRLPYVPDAEMTCQESGVCHGEVAVLSETLLHVPKDTTASVPVCLLQRRSSVAYEYDPRDPINGLSRGLLGRKVHIIKGSASIWLLCKCLCQTLAIAQSLLKLWTSSALRPHVSRYVRLSLVLKCSSSFFGTVYVSLTL